MANRFITAATLEGLGPDKSHLGVGERRSSSLDKVLCHLGPTLFPSASLSVTVRVQR